jgi:DNA-binding response OmpR family regulator/two-component sensor histidine kinase
VRISEIASFVETTFKPISEARNLKFKIETDYELPAVMETDIQRLNQILKNLLSNAFKFTEKGEVTLKIFEAHKSWRSGVTPLDKAPTVVGFSIHDTGIGIPLEKQSIIFEAFQQAEGSTSRKYGGTGLGLSISRGLAELLGGTIELESEAGRGSTFTLYLPLNSLADLGPREVSESMKVIQQLQLDTDGNQIDNLLGNLRITNEGVESRSLDIVNEMINETGDDRSHVQPNDRIVLIVEDDLRFGKILIEKAHEKGLKAVVATNYLEVFDFINRFSPIALTLDVKLPETSGWKVIDLLRSDLNYRHIPIHVISGEENRVLALKRGARSFLLKPLDNDLLNSLFDDIISYYEKETKRVLIVEDNEIDSSQIAKMHRDDKLAVRLPRQGRKLLTLCIMKF